MKKATLYPLLILLAVVLANVLVHFCSFRLDLSEDKRYSLAPSTKDLLLQTIDPIEVTIYLDGDLNAGFQRLRSSVDDLLREYGEYADVEYDFVNPAELSKESQVKLQEALAKQGLYPIPVYEKDRTGKQIQSVVYPFAHVKIGQAVYVPLLSNIAGKSGAENLNASTENLEYVFDEAIRTLSRGKVEKIAFIEGHGELPEIYTYDISLALSRYFQIDRGSLTADANVLQEYACLIIADPQLPFSEADKYVLDQYVQHGGKILWVVSGTSFSQQMLSSDGYTPAIALDLNLTDMLFRYGVRIQNALVQDVQCLAVPVNVSQNPQQPQYQPMPWCYAPLLLTSAGSAITKNVAPVSATFPSYLEAVGEDDGISKEALLATSNASRVIPVPAQVDLMDMNPDPQTFRYAFLPVAVSLEGHFPSIFAHQVKPEGCIAIDAPVKPSKQIVVASGSIIRNEVQQGQPLPVGYDRYSARQFGNRDFLQNAVLWLTDEDGLISLRQKEVILRQLNTVLSQHFATKIIILTIAFPLLILVLVGGITLVVRKRKYAL